MFMNSIVGEHKAKYGTVFSYYKTWLKIEKRESINQHQLNVNIPDIIDT